MRRPLRWLIATAGASLAFAVLPAAALADSSPVIEGESAQPTVLTDELLEATINPEGLSPFGAYYQFQVATSPSGYLPDLACPERGEWLHPWFACIGAPTPGVLPIGVVGPGTAGRPAILDLASVGMTLKPGTTYHYRVLAATAKVTEDTLEWEGPTAYGPDQTFTTPSTPPTGVAPVIDSVSVSHLTPTDATLEAQINTEGLPAMYDFLMSYSPCARCEGVATFEIPLPFGLLDGSFVDQSVSLDLGSAGVTLRPGGVYGYSLTAVGSGVTEAKWQTFEPPLGVIDPPKPATTPLPGGGPASPSGGGGGSTGSATLPTALTPSSSPGATKSGSAGHTAKHKHKHKHHGTKAVKRRAKVKKHKR